MESLTSNATDLAVPCSLAVAPLSLVLQPGAGVHVPALAVTQVVLPLADVLVAVGVEVVAAAGATVVRPFTCSSTLPHQHTLRGRSRAGAVRSGQSERWQSERGRNRARKVGRNRKVLGWGTDFGRKFLALGSSDFAQIFSIPR